MDSFDPVIKNTSLTLLTSNQPFPEKSCQKFLHFLLGPQNTGLLPLEQISEVLRVNVADILPVPEMPSCVLGIYNWRGKILWFIDLGHLVDYPPLSQQGRDLSCLMALVIQVNDQYLGLVVQYVKDIELRDIENIQPSAAGLFPPKLLPFVKGYLPGINGIVIDTEAIARYPLWQVHRI